MSSQTTRAIALFDWGIGGLSVLKPLLKLSNEELDIIYVSDAGFTPYGLLSSQEMQTRLSALFHNVITNHRVDQLVIACNAASTAYIGQTEHQSVRLSNVIEPITEGLFIGESERIGVIGGELTVASGIYQKLLSRYHVVQVATQALSALVEAGQLSGDQVQDIVSEQLAVFKKKPVDKLILACTHYPALAPIIGRSLPGVELVDPAEYLAMSLLGESAMGATSVLNHKVRYFSTGSIEKMMESAKRAFDINIESVAPLVLEYRF